MFVGICPCGCPSLVAQTINIELRRFKPHNHYQMPASRKKTRAPRGINYGLLTDETKKLQYFKSHLPTRVGAIRVRGRDVKSGDQVIMDIAGDDSGTSTSDDVCIAEVVEIRSPDHDKHEVTILCSTLFSFVGIILGQVLTNVFVEYAIELMVKLKVLQNLQDPGKAIKNFSNFKFSPRELVSSDHMQVFPAGQLMKKISVRTFHETSAEQSTIGPDEWWCRYFWSTKQSCLLLCNKSRSPITACGMGDRCIKGHYFAPHLEYQRFCSRGSCQIWYHIECLQSAQLLVKFKLGLPDLRLRLMLHGTLGFEWIDDPYGDMKFFEDIKSCLSYIHGIVDCAQYAVVRGREHGIVGNFLQIKRARTLLVEAHQNGWPSDEEIAEFASWKPPADALYRCINCNGII
ncbi:unnamed protein product [Rhizoctonia solani]|uniref:Uncharacterized protein n=1 Tax=Rhizoctonia solani TaxID=456999 RepID=A0A8H3GIR5_9AGAM|nr:unnamed protein product [Rhizoctonia solani]